MGNCVIPQQSKNKQLEQPTSSVPCNICLQNIQSKQRLVLSCSHIFHKSCLHKTYEVKIYQRYYPMKCPDCNTEIDYYIMKNILPQSLFSLYQKILLQNALLLDEHIFFCPTPDCTAIYQIIPSEFRYFQCIACKIQFCLICHKAYHGKTQCPIQTKQQSNYLKNCPKCKIGWFKTTGCNHVQCKVCHYLFCYKCGGQTCGVSVCKQKSN